MVPDTNTVYYLADGAGKPVTANDIKEAGIYYIYKKTYNTDPHDEQNVTISIVRQAEAGEGKDFTYPATSSEATGLYQYIDNHIKNFDLSWQILDWFTYIYIYKKWELFKGPSFYFYIVLLLMITHQVSPLLLFCIYWILI